MTDHHHPQRRRFLGLAGRVTAACLAVPVLHQLGGCGGGGEQAVSDGTLRVPLAELPPGERVYRELGDVTIELHRQGEEITARSMMCTHQGCVVQWRPAEQEYFCPCHEGRFDADGAVIEGMPTRPLARYPVRLEQDVVVVGP